VHQLRRNLSLRRLFGLRFSFAPSKSRLDSCWCPRLRLKNRPRIHTFSPRNPATALHARPGHFLICASYLLLLSGYSLSFSRPGRLSPAHVLAVYVFVSGSAASSYFNLFRLMVCRPRTVSLRPLDNSIHSPSARPPHQRLFLGTGEMS